MTDFCPNLSADPAVVFVSDGHNRFTDLTTRTYQLAVDNINRLTGPAVRPVEFSVSFDFPDQLTTFQKPPRPVLDADKFEFRAPPNVGAAPTFLAQPVAADPVPVLDAVAPDLVFGPRPTAPAITAPTAPARPAPLVIPDAPTYELPQVPTFESLNIPAAPSITLPEFDAEKPVFVEPPFTENWSFTPQAYTGQLLSQLQDKVRVLLVGQEALPLAIERALFDRGRTRIEIETQRDVDQAFAECGARGFSEPTGPLLQRVLQIRQGGQDRLGELNRDVSIESFKEALANMRLALSQGAALEGLTINLHVEEQRFALQAASFQRETAIAILNARVTVFNARMQGYQIEAQVSEARIRAELAKVEVFRAQIQAELARGEVNEQRIRLYAERLRAIQIMADFHRTQVEAVKVQADANRAQIDIFRAEVDAYGERWRAHVAEWQGYTASVEAEGKKSDVYGKMVDAFGERIRAWGTQQTVRVDNERLRIAQHGQQLQAWDGENRRFDGLLQAERTRLTAVLQQADAYARMYVADGTIEQAASAAHDRTFELGLQRARAHVDTQLETARISIQQNIALIQELRGVREVMAQVSTQLAASVMSAVNYSASVSSGRSDSQNCSTNYSFQGEIADAGI